MKSNKLAEVKQDLMTEHLTKKSGMGRDMPIVLIGMMGAGKTTLGRNLADRLTRSFLDSDQEIEKEQQLSIAGIFNLQGEAYFRRLEQDKISALLEKRNIVLSVGGGAITNPTTAELIFTRSVSIWIDAPIDTLAARVGRDTSRPLLAGQDVKQTLLKKLKERKDLYASADLRLVNDGDLKTVTDTAVRQIDNYLLKI